jgi:trafficking protein particle complex subunit 13
MQLTLPLAFGSAYVGETFDCTICVNNELSNSANRKVTSVKIAAEMQTPSQMLPLQLSNKHEEAAQHGLDIGDSVQAIVHFDLREEGSHTLIVSISYNEALHASETNTASGGRVRSFRKLYQFMAVRSTTIESPRRHANSHCRVLASRFARKHRI